MVRNMLMAASAIVGFIVISSVAIFLANPFVWWMGVAPGAWQIALTFTGAIIANGLLAWCIVRGLASQISFPGIGKKIVAVPILALMLLPSLLILPGAAAATPIIDEDGNIFTEGNIYLLGHRLSPIKIFMGKDLDNGFYGFVMERPDGSLLTGFETFRRPDPRLPVSSGYGAYPIRLWGSNILIEANGVVVARDLVASKLILQEPVTVGGGGITWNPEDMGTYMTRDGPDLILYHNGREIMRWR